MLQTEKELNELLVRKEQEWKELQARQLCFQKTTLQDTRKQLQEMHKKFNKLKEDFTYNLRVLEERDRELAHYDSMFTRLKTAENAKQAEVSDLRIQLDKLQQTLIKETQKQEDLKYQYQQKLKEQQLELERLHSAKDQGSSKDSALLIDVAFNKSKVSDIDHHCEEYKKLKQQLERKLQEVEGELALQKQELLVEFDAEIKKKEHEFRQQADEMSNLVLSHELKVKLLTKELEALKEAGMKAAESLQIAETTNLKLEKEAKCKDWEFKDLAAEKDARIHNLECKLHLIHLTWQKEVETFQEKHEVLDHFAKEKDAVLASVKEVHAEQIQKWENQIRELQISHEALEVELRRREWRHEECLRKKDTVIEKLQGELATLKISWDSRLAQVSKETISKDLQIQSLHEEEVMLRAELAVFQQDIERYKQQLFLASEREQILEQAKVQAELDWQRRCENAERNQYQKSEDLIESLSTARDQVTAQLQEKEQKLCEMETVLSALTFERDQAVQALQKHGILPEEEKQIFLGDIKGVLGKDFPSTEIQRLKDQNISLRAAIAEMRKEMETLSDQTPSSFPMKEKTPQTATDAEAAAVIFTPDYVRSLEEEIRKLKHKCWIMEEQLEKADKFIRKSSATSHDLSSTQHQSVPSSTRLHSHNCNETRGAFCADDVFSGALVKKQEARTAHLDTMVTQHIQKGTVIKELQEEIVDLRQQLSGVGSGDGPHQCMNCSVQEMQSKLKEAVRKISILSQEKQQLIEMGNRLRAELGVVSKEGLQHYISSKQCPVHTVSGALCPKELANEAQHRLSALEHLQYQLTTQELQYVQRQRFSRLSSMIAFPSSIESLNGENAQSSCGQGAELPQVQVQLESSVRNCSLEKQKECTSSETNQSHQLSRDSASQSQQAWLSPSGVPSSLQDIWQILDMGSSPSVLSPQSNTDQVEFKATHAAKSFEESQQNFKAGDRERAPAADLTIKGTSFEVQPQLTASKSSHTHPIKSKISHQMQKIWNYNVKD